MRVVFVGLIEVFFPPKIGMKYEKIITFFNFLKIG